MERNREKIIIGSGFNGMDIVVAITGASGTIYGIRLLEELKKHNVYLILSEEAKKLIEYENNYDIEKIKSMAIEYYDENQMESRLASGSFKHDAMVIAPCSIKTLAAIANGFAFNLITRTALCTLKEGRKLVVVPRETPLDLITLENMVRLKRAGAVMLPAMPAFYHKPRSVNDMVDFIVGKILEQIGVKHDLYEEWKP